VCVCVGAWVCVCGKYMCQASFLSSTCRSCDLSPTHLQFVECGVRNNIVFRQWVSTCDDKVVSTPAEQHWVVAPMSRWGAMDVPIRLPQILNRCYSTIKIDQSESYIHSTLYMSPWTIKSIHWPQCKTCMIFVMHSDSEHSAWVLKHLAQGSQWVLKHLAG